MLILMLLGASTLHKVVLVGFIWVVDIVQFVLTSCGCIIYLFTFVLQWAFFIGPSPQFLLKI
jgi:hypothetical protein